jgi:hypothetical protein
LPGDLDGELKPVYIEDQSVLRRDDLREQGPKDLSLFVDRGLPPERFHIEIHEVAPCLPPLTDRCSTLEGRRLWRRSSSGSISINHTVS